MPGIPSDRNNVIPHLLVRGGADALTFYAKAFGAQEVMRMPGPDGKGILHAEIRIGNSHIYLADAFPGIYSQAPSGSTTVVIHVYVDDVDQVYARALAAGARGSAPPMDMFWGDRYAKVIDPFGHEWSLATRQEEVPPEELGRRAEEAMRQWQKGP